MAKPRPIKLITCRSCGAGFMAKPNAQRCASCKPNRGNFSATSTDDPGWPKGHKQCDIEGCSRPSARMTSKLCRMHYSRLRKTGITGPAEMTARESRDGACRFEGCDRPIQSSLTCAMHIARLKRHGDPDKVISHNEQAYMRGEEHHAWMGDRPSYEAAHRRIDAAHGKAKTHTCVGCGGPGAQWSYDHGDADEMLYEYKPGKYCAYSADMDRYQARCMSCHTRFDMAHADSAPKYHAHSGS